MTDREISADRPLGSQLVLEGDAITEPDDGRWHKITLVAYVKGTPERVAQRALEFCDVPLVGAYVGQVGCWTERVQEEGDKDA